MTEKNKVLSDAPGVLNKPDQPWEVTVEGDSIIARWRWMDATFFAPAEVNKEVKDFQFIVTLTDKGKYKELDKTEKKSSNVSMQGGKIGFGGSTSSFSGKSSQKSFSIGLGADNKTGEVGVLVHKFDTALVKKPIREYLESCGWKKAGLFG